MDLQRNSFGGARKVTPPVIPELSEVKSHEQPAYRGSYIATDQVAGIPPRIPVGQSKKAQVRQRLLRLYKHVNFLYV